MLCFNDTHTVITVEKTHEVQHQSYPIFWNRFQSWSKIMVLITPPRPTAERLDAFVSRLAPWLMPMAVAAILSSSVLYLKGS